MTKAVVLGRAISHDSSACLVVDGEVVVAIASERLSRKKHDHEHNDLAIRYCLEAGGVSLADVDVIVQSSPKHSFRGGNESDLIGDDDPRVWTISHHLAHAWSAFGTSGFEDCAIVVIDGRGSFVPPHCDLVMSPLEVRRGYAPDDLAIEVESIYAAECGQLRLVDRIRNRGLPSSIGTPFSSRDGRFPDEYSGYYQYAGLGALYEQACYGLFNSNLDGGKVMGLAGFGTPAPDLVDRILREARGGGYELGTDWLFELSGPIDVDDEFERAANLAASVQEALERGVMLKFEKASKLTGSGRLCYTGGVALNGVANEKLMASSLFEDVFIQPPCIDSGTSIGCALFGYGQVLGKPLVKHRYRDFLGRRYSAGDVHEALQAMARYVHFREIGDPVRHAVDTLSEGKTLGWFQGRSEFGPRALGHRSILSLPRPVAVRDRINAQVKRREGFRPYAPAVPLEDASRFFELDGSSPFMLRVVAVREEWRDALSAVVHVDGTARVQTVSEESDPVFHRLLCEVGIATGTPVLLNTSFNTAGFPMVESPEDALRVFLASGVDHLVLGNWAVDRRYSNAAEICESATWVLAPAARIERCRTSAGKESALLRKGPRVRELQPSDAESLIRILEGAVVPLESERVVHLLEDLLRSGWIHGASAE